jgi:spoIIIJ-associated protein
MEWVETTGRTLEEAKDAALDQLGVDEQDAEFEILEEPKSGLFGRLRSEARVRARVRPTRPRPKDDRQRRRGTAGRRGGRDRVGADAGAGEGGRTEQAVGGSERTGDRGEPRTPARPPRPRATRNGDEMDDDVPLDQQAAVAKGFLEGLVAEFGHPAAAVAVHPVDDDTVEVRVTGDDLGLLIGPRGQTLTAIQELVRTVVQRQTGAHNGRLIVDVAGYRQARREALSRFTREVAGRVLESGQSMALEPMSAADRKVVHDTANEIDGVGTSSEGEEPRRRVVILPDAAT